MSETDDTVAELRALVAELGARVRTLEAQAEQTEQSPPEVSEAVLLAISAACAAYLGKRATVKQVHLRRGVIWVSQGRAVTHSHNIRR